MKEMYAYRSREKALSMLPVFLLLYSIVGLFLGLISHKSIINYGVLGVVPFFIFLLGRKKYAETWFFIFIYLICIPPYFLLYLGGGDFSSWREGMLSKQQNLLGLISIVKVINFCILYVVIKEMLGKKNFDSPVYNVSDRFWSFYPRLFSILLASASLVLYFPMVYGQSREAFLGGGGAADVTMLNVAFLFIYISSSYGFIGWMVGKLNLLAGLFPLLVSALYAYSGFRYCLIGCVLIFVTCYLYREKLGIIKMVVFVVGGLAFYLMLTLAAMSRNLDVSFLSVVADVFSGRLDLSAVAVSFGAHEQNIYYSFLKTIESGRFEHGLLYLDSIIRVLPSFLYSEFFDTRRVNDVVLEVGAPSHMLGTSLNLGAFFLAEAYLNFGRVGLYAIPLFFLYAVGGLQRRASKSFSYLMIYFVIVANIPNYVYYGSNSILKLIFYSFIFIYIFRMLASLGGFRSIR